MSQPRPDPPDCQLPPTVEQLASEILLGSAETVDPAFEALCVAHEPLRPALQRLRVYYQRAARFLTDPSAPAPSLPAAIGPYRIVRQIGEGAFGVVFLAEQQTPIRRQVAIKLLHTTACSPTTTSRFRNERETLARMNHPAIARIFDAGVDDQERLYFVMEYVLGEPLDRFVATRAADLTARIELFLAACDGVKHAHQRGVIHRDLKPQNILVSEIDGKWLPKVIDFGLAKVVDSDPITASKTHAGTVLGTPAYMSPEQVRGDAHEADIRTDVYALGVILYELLTGTLPIDPQPRGSTGLVELQRLILEFEPPLASVRAARSGLPHARNLRGDLDWILRKALAKHEDERYASVAEFATDLRRHLVHQPVTAGPPSTIYMLRKFVRRHRVPVVAATLLLASLLLGLLVSTRLYHEADANARRAQGHLADFWRLADVLELDELVGSAKDLWPSSPDRLADHQRWLDRAHGLLERRALHAETLQALQARLADGIATTMAADEARGARFLLDRLQTHLANLDDFASDHGPAHDMESRTRFARTVQARSIDEPRAAWECAIRTVAASPRYGGLQLAPILGLVPLGADPTSGLEEFAHLQSGTVPERDAAGRLSSGDDTAIVLVLVPGGRATIGSQGTDPELPHHDPWRQLVESDVETAAYDAFLIGKYELTQSQVRTLGVPVQALSRAGTPRLDGSVFTARHPEESVLVPALTAWLPHFELRLPTMAEWEIAARAGSPTIWGSGDRVEALQGHANVADATLAEANPADKRADPRVRDGFLTHAPVGSFLPNGFGLYDILGNVAELTVAPTETGSVVYLARGGSYMLSPLDSRIGSIRQVMPNQTTPEIGMRVARSLHRD